MKYKQCAKSHYGEPSPHSGEEERVPTFESDRQRSENVRRIWPFLRDRRIGAYGDPSSATGTNPRRI